MTSVSAVSWSWLRPSKTSCRTVSTWAGAARSMAARPAAVRTANAPRASLAQSSPGDQAAPLHPGELVRDPALLPGQRVGDLEHPQPALGRPR